VPSTKVVGTFLCAVHQESRQHLDCERHAERACYFVGCVQVAACPTKVLPAVPGPWILQLVSICFWQRVLESSRPATYHLWADVIEGIGVEINSPSFLAFDGPLTVVAATPTMCSNLRALAACQQATQQQDAMQRDRTVITPRIVTSTHTSHP
jgi:hypothetical protein